MPGSKYGGYWNGGVLRGSSVKISGSAETRNRPVNKHEARQQPAGRLPGG